MTLDLNSNLSFVSQQFGGLQNDGNPQTIIDGYALLGARATLNGQDDRWSVSLFGNNLLDKQYEAGNLYQLLGANLASNNGVFTGQHGRPAASRRSAHLRCVGYLPLLVPSWGRGSPAPVHPRRAFLFRRGEMLDAARDQLPTV